MLTAYMIHRADTPRYDMAAAAKGVLRSGGQYWNRYDNNWRPANAPRDIFTPSERDTFPLPTGGEWIEIYIEETLGAITN